MTFSVTLGRYVARDSVVHHLDARAKVVLCVVYAVALFALPGWVGLSTCTVLFALAYAAAQLPARLILRALKPLAFLLALTVLCSLFTFSADTESARVAESAVVAAGSGQDALASSLASNFACFWETGTLPLVGQFGISLPGLANGVLLALRVALFLAVTALLTYTTTLVDIADACGALLRPLGRLGVPVEDAAVVVALTLRFVPATLEEADRIKRAQQARGLRFNQGGLLQRAQAFVPVLIPLFVSLFRRAERLACALEARCYTSQHRTHLPTAQQRAAR